MKLLISGATGFIGKHLTERLAKEGNEVFAIVRPSTDTSTLTTGNIRPYVFNDDIHALTAFLEQEQFDGIIHLASLFLAAHKSDDIKNLVDSNVLFPTTLLESAVTAKTPWFINTGTFWQHYQNEAYSPVNLYAATKQAFEDIAQYYLQTSPVNFVTIQLSDTFGPGDTRAKVFNLWLKTSKSQDPLGMSPGEQLIDISFIDNVIDGYVQMISLLSSDKGPELRGRAFAISSGAPESLKSLAATFEEVTGTTLPIQWGEKEYRPREVMETWNKGETIPGWSPRVSIEEGIKRTFHE
ncbi:MAG: NAD-dependent dehydratase [Patescibacteria group bacterium]|jgi:nucleoside-diphosphate-sugar epimerase|nr:NAD-dependent dehydratase [Patescibacteria group bacterium]